MESHGHERRTVTAARFAPYPAKPKPLAHDVALAIKETLDRSTDSRSAWSSGSFCAPSQATRRRKLLVSRLQLAERHAEQMSAMLAEKRKADAMALLHEHEINEMSHAADVQHVDDAENGCSVCVICLEPAELNLGDPNQLEALPCGHVFHRTCIRTWTRYNRVCPIDRLPLS